MGVKMITLWWILPLVILGLVLGFYGRNLLDKAELHQITQDLDTPVRQDVETYDPALVSDLPEAAQRYFNFSLQPGAKLYRNVRLEMHGELGLGDKAQPNYFPFTATQFIVPDRGFTWALRSNSFPMLISGSDMMWDDQSWTRFWLFGIVPVARDGGSDDHFKSAEGRLLVELAAWSPGALLPQNGVTWTQEGPNIARAWLTTSTGRHWVDVHLNEDGQPKAYVIERWSNANAEGQYRPQPFGGTPSTFITIEGTKIAAQVDVGNHFGTEDYFPFFKASLDKIEFF